ncbi:Multimodular transpeptidase-transglycosylase [Altererythrobacter epoxidivorans]|uniref:Multimodular transpeptidase-transglycosylase n=1 Tax=Altererythrobacter epoxidivorans TaxID=361183 RepID=A0A0M5L4S0_9SPHN|nr:transglycosylase domain-containing protein [Altererythrobacter epoxidivorans]ALE15861.1 Multimodular transpeptidase-transglycosylase [Altererythrobacter epoxidivorans]
MFNWFRSSRRNPAHSGADGEGDAGFYSLQEPYGSAWDDADDWPRGWDDERSTHRSERFADWDDRLDRIDDHLGETERRRLPWWRPAHWRGRRKRWWAVRIVAAIFALFILIIAWLALTAPLSKSLQPIASPQITLLASDGTPIARSGAMVEEPVEVEKLPDHVVEAFLAIEDRRFYDHWGIDPRGLARAALSNLTGGSTQGGSTITQQLAKFTFLDSEQTLTRKGREMLIAFWLEAWLTKDEILERYLSNAYFGDNQYGLRAASLHYFYRQPEKLRPEQAAMLAGLLKAPSRLAPTKNYDLARERMKLVVGSMVAAGYMTEEEARRLPAPRLDVRARNDVPTGTYFADWALPIARQELERGYARQTITTTLDSRLQKIASRVVANAPLGNAQIALVAMRPNGEVVAMIGGRNYAKSPFNRVTQAKRQPGSTFKLFDYVAAIRAGMEPDDLIDNSEITEGAYRPKNAAGRYSDSITLEDAFARSSNVAAVRLYYDLGGEKIIDTARDLGVTSPLPSGDPSLALGTSTMTLLELTSAYAGIAGNTFPVKAHAFPQGERGWFDWLTSGEKSLSSRKHQYVEQLLRASINKGTGRAAMLSVPNFGKTGTTQDNRDALFVGYAGDLVVGVWIGNDDNSPLKGISGGGLPARIWRDFMRSALSGANGPVPEERPDPEGPVQPMDVPELGDIPFGLQVRNGQLIFSGDESGIPLDIVLDDEGVRIDPERLERAIEQRQAQIDQREIEREQARAIEEAARELEQQLQEAGR